MKKIAYFVVGLMLFSCLTAIGMSEEAGEDLETMPKAESIPILTKWWKSLGPQNQLALFMGLKSLEEKSGKTKGFYFQDPETLDMNTIAQIYYARKFLPLNSLHFPKN